MCRAFSCLVTPKKKVIWKFGVDSHSQLQQNAGIRDNTADPAKMLCAKIEITPDNNDYLYPDNWTLRVDESIRPAWLTIQHEEACLKEHKKWLRMLNNRLIHKSIITPFKIKPPKVIKAHIVLLCQWDSVRDSVWDGVWDSVGDSVWDSVGNSVGDSVWNSVGDSVRNSVGNSVWDSVGNSVRNSVWDSVWAYTGSFFKIKKWKYIKHLPGEYPFQSVVKLWEKGLVPSFDGTYWRLHGGPKAEVLFKIHVDKLRKGK